MQFFENLLNDHWILTSLLFVGITVFMVSVASHFIRKYIHSNILKQHHELAGFIIATLGVLYAVFLGLTVTDVQKQNHDIKSRVNKEAYLTADLIRFARNLNDPARREIQQGVRTYLKSIIDDEWKLLGEKKESPKTLEKFKDLWIPIYNYQVTSTQDGYWFSSCLEILTHLNSARLERIYTSWTSLGIISWLNLIIGALTLISLLLFFGTENTRAQFALNALFVGALTFMVLSIFLLSSPFNPPEPLKPKAYEMVYNHYSESLEHTSPQKI